MPDYEGITDDSNAEGIPATTILENL